MPKGLPPLDDDNDDGVGDDFARRSATRTIARVAVLQAEFTGFQRSVESRLDDLTSAIKKISDTVGNIGKTDWPKIVGLAIGLFTVGLATVTSLGAAFILPMQTKLASVVDDVAKHQSANGHAALDSRIASNSVKIEGLEGRMDRQLLQFDERLQREIQDKSTIAVQASRLGMWEQGLIKRP